MIIKWPERYSLVMLLHAFIHELKYRTEMTNKQQENRKKHTTTTENEIATKYEISEAKEEAPPNQMNETKRHKSSVYTKYTVHTDIQIASFRKRIAMTIHFHFVGNSFVWVKIAASDRKKTPTSDDAAKRISIIS